MTEKPALRAAHLKAMASAVYHVPEAEVNVRSQFS